MTHLVGWQGALEPKHILAQVGNRTPYPLLTCPFPFLLHKTGHEMGCTAAQVQGVMLYDGPYFLNQKSFGYEQSPLHPCSKCHPCHCMLLMIGMSLDCYKGFSIY